MEVKEGAAKNLDENCITKKNTGHERM